ncbi:MAG: hypothetical protein MJA30_11325 [Cytophagales bacterium]|nr:hypothetical protein [Cytophagales bacterium]
MKYAFTLVIVILSLSSQGQNMFILAINDTTCSNAEDIKFQGVQVQEYAIIGRLDDIKSFYKNNQEMSSKLVSHWGSCGNFGLPEDIECFIETNSSTLDIELSNTLEFHFVNSDDFTNVLERKESDNCDNNLLLCRNNQGIYKSASVSLTCGESSIKFSTSGTLELKLGKISLGLN